MSLRITFANLLVVAASIVLMSAATASATTITSSEGATPTIKAEAEGHVILDNPIAKIECASKFEGKVESHGAGVTTKGNVSALSFTGCTNSWHVTVISAGSLEVHALSGGNGTLTSSGATVEATRFGITCRYATSSTDLGTLTGGTNATLDVSASIPFHSGSGLCGSGATTWTGSYKVSSPTNLSVDEAQPEAELVRRVTLNGKAPKTTYVCEFDKTKETELCEIEFEVLGKGAEEWKVVESKWFPANGGEQFKVAQGCTKGKKLKVGENCTDVVNNIKNEEAEVIWCVEIEVPAGGAGPNCTTLSKK